MGLMEEPAAWGAIAQIAVAATLGLVFGSFANVCIHRLPERRSVVWPGSACPQCAAPIRWHDNIPVLSWLWLLGRCRACRAPIPIGYPAIEASCAIFLAALCARHGLTSRWVALSWLAVSILVLVPIDLRHGILPDRVTLTGLGAGLLLSPFSEDPGWIGAVTGAAVGALVPLAIRGLYMIYARARAALARPAAHGEEPAPPGQVEPPAEPEHAEERREGMGLGDVKMLAMVGAFLGVSKVLLTMLLGSVIGTIYVMPLVLSGRHSMKTPVPFGPFLGVAAIVAMFWGTDIIDWYLNLVVRLPFG